jgi:D-alanine-D-alanine ligase
MKIIVLHGGPGSEAAVSRTSAKGVLEALIKLGYEAVLLEFEPTNFIQDISVLKPDLVYNSMHGEWGEDGRIPTILDVLGVKYTHSGYEPSHLAMNKFGIEGLVESFGLVKTAKSRLFHLSDLAGTDFKKPIFIKPNEAGSSVGSCAVLDGKITDYHIDILKNSGYELFVVSDLISGTEVSVGVLENKAVGIVEIQPIQGFYDYTNKYTAGKTNYIMPPQIPDKTAALIMQATQKLHETLGCKFISRTDFIIGRDGGAYFLEINTHPGFTPTSLIPRLAKHYKNMDYAEIVDKIVKYFYAL